MDLLSITNRVAEEKIKQERVQLGFELVKQWQREHTDAPQDIPRISNK